MENNILPTDEDPIKIINGDCIDILKRLPDKCIDLVVTDPPYGIDLNYDVYKDTKDNWRQLMIKLIPELKRVAKMVIMPSCQIAEMGWMYDNFKPDWIIAWYKGSPGHRSFIGFNDWEPLLVFGKTDGTIMHDYFYCQPTPFDNGHPCPKPISWARWLIQRASKEGDIVSDPFLGSGTVALACKQLKRKCLGIEISKDYIEISKNRLKQKILNL